MPRSLAQNIKQVRDKIGGVRAALADIELAHTRLQLARSATAVRAPGRDGAADHGPPRKEGR